MNLMGKIFTFIIFFMSIAFFAVAIMVGASHREWKEVAQENSTAAKRFQRLLTEARKIKNDKEKLLAAEKVSRTAQIAQLEAQLVVLRTQVAAKESLLGEEEVRARQRLQAMNEAEARLKAQDAQVVVLSEQNIKYADDLATQRVSVVNLTNVLNETQGSLKMKEQLVEDMRDQLANNQRILNAYGLESDALTQHIAPALDGIVLESQDNIIVLSLGSDDGLRAGHVVDIFRGDQFVGKAVVQTSRKNMASALIQPEYENKGPVQEGDIVTTKF